MKNIALLLSTLTLCACAAEVAFRLAGFEPKVLEANRFFVDGTETTWSVPDPELGWINRPGTSVSIEAGSAPMTYWSFGRRASRANEERRPAGPSVMIVGGSNAQSYGVTDEHSFPFRLGARFPNLWIENFGNGGYGTVQTMLLTERLLEDFYKGNPPALIIATFADSHIARNVSDQSWIYNISDSSGRFVSPPHYRKRGDHLTFYPYETIGLWPLERQSALITTVHHMWLQSVAYATADQGPDVTRHIFGRLDAAAQRYGSQFLVAVLEDYGQVAEGLFQNTPYDVIDCSGFERTAPQEYLLGGGGHPNARYHQHYADCIGDWLAVHFGAAKTPSSL